MQSEPIHDVRCFYDLRVPMPDGVKLSADVYLPRDGKRSRRCCCARLTKARAKPCRLGGLVGAARLRLRD